MDSTSASIVVLAGAVCLCAGAYIPDSTFRMVIVMGTGALLILVGLLYWAVSMAPRERMQDEDEADDDETDEDDDD